MVNNFQAATLLLSAIVLASIVLLSACSPPVVGNAEDGKRWFTMHNCYACHGKDANNGQAPKIAGLNRSFASFVRFIRNPDSARMPSFAEETVSRQDAADIYAWLQSLPE